LLRQQLTHCWKSCWHGLYIDESLLLRIINQSLLHRFSVQQELREALRGSRAVEADRARAATGPLVARMEMLEVERVQVERDVWRGRQELVLYREDVAERREEVHRLRA
jgi:hypothetical protein